MDTIALKVMLVLRANILCGSMRELTLKARHDGGRRLVDHLDQRVTVHLLGLLTR